VTERWWPSHPGIPRRPPGREQILRTLVAVAVLVAIFGFALPRLADYGEAWDAIAALTALEVGLLGIVGLWNLVTYWPVMMLAQPGLRLREAAVVNQASTAVANTVPAGSAVAVGATFRILRDWGFTTESITNLTVLTGVWNQLAKLSMPVIAVVAVAATGELESSFIRLAVWGVVAVVAVVALGAALLGIPAVVTRLGRGLDRFASSTLRRVRRPRPTAIAPWLARLRDQTLQVVRHRSLPLSLATIVSHLSLYAVLLVSIRMMGVPAEELSWSRVLVGFSLVRLLSAVPVTPGGVGVVELGYVGFLTADSAAGLEHAVTAAVLLFRAITYALPVALGGLAWVLYQRADSWRRAPDSRGTGAVDPVVLPT
jgi:putative heme transporter